jgi:predicted alpha-1,2-mannosidase
MNRQRPALLSAASARWRRLAVIGAVLAAVSGLAANQTAAAGVSQTSGQAPADPAALVQPLAGTTNGGGTFPGASLPFGMVQYSPDTPDAEGGGYEYSAAKTYGFSPVHLSGPGCAAEGDAVSLPTTGAVTSLNLPAQPVAFSHADEHATPGDYDVTLASGINVGLTSTTRTGWARYEFPASASAGQHNLLVEPGAGFMGASAADVHVVGDNTVEGDVTTWGYFGTCNGKSRNTYTLHFSMVFDQPFSSFGTGSGTSLQPGSRSATGTASAAWMTFAPGARTVTSRMGISFTSLANARANLAAESRGQTFDSVRATAHSVWNSQLRRVAISGGTAAQQSTFYTALYHSMLEPTVYSDVNGQYTGFDGKVHTTPHGQLHYTDFSMWDTYRSEQELLDLVAPGRVPDMVSSLLADYQQGGWLPRWPYANYYTNEMVGDPAADILTDAYLKGLIRPQDVSTAYAALLKNADDLPYASQTGFVGRSGLDDYLNDGYVPYVPGTQDQFAPSMQLEYSVNDCALSLFADGYGQQADAQRFLDRAQRYRNLIDTASGTVRAKLPDGSWYTPFDPTSQTTFKEGSADQYTWLVPQDMPGLTALLGGQATTVSKLDQFFDYSQLVTDPSGVAASDWGPGSQYNPTNEDDLQAPYLYDYLGEPYKTADVVRAAETLYSTTPSGIPGNDDLGEMSSWYVMSALGIYPVMAGAPSYELASPLFPHAVVSVDRPGRRPAEITINAPATSATNRYIQAVQVNGRALNTPEVSDATLASGATLDFDLVSSPTTWATAPSDVASSACAATPHAADVRLAFAGTPVPVAAGGSTTVSMTLDNAGNVAATRPEVSLALPAGWTAKETTVAPASLAPGATATVAFTVSAPAGAASGSTAFRAYASWKGAGGQSKALTTLALGTLSTT